MIKMKKIDPSKYQIVCIWALIVLFIAMIVFALFCLLDAAIFNEWENAQTAIVAYLLVAICSFFALLWCDRKIYRVWIEDGVIKQLSLLKRRTEECRIEDIKLVVTFYAYREEEHIALINEFIPKDQIKPQKYIHFRKTKKNMEFLRTFWHGRIEKL